MEGKPTNIRRIKPIEARKSVQFVQSPSRLASNEVQVVIICIICKNHPGESSVASVKGTREYRLLRQQTKQASSFGRNCIRRNRASSDARTLVPSDGLFRLYLIHLSCSSMLISPEELFRLCMPLMKLLRPYQYYPSCFVCVRIFQVTSSVLTSSENVLPISYETKPRQTIRSKRQTKQRQTI